MARPRNAAPSYLQKGDKGRAVWTDAAGRRQYRTLPGAYQSAESRQAFARLLLELATEPAAVDVPRGRGLSIAELIDAFLAHAREHYRGRDGRVSTQYDVVRSALIVVNANYGLVQVADFGPLALKAVRQVWVAAGIARTEANRRTRIVRQAFKWAAGEELIPFEVYHRLTAVAGLQKGRTSARETEPVGPVEDAAVDATLPFLNRHVRGLVEFQRLTGCRPGEACLLRQVDIDMAGPVWTYRPEHHKTAHRGKDRVIAIGPKAQAVIREFFTNDPTAYLFSPRRAVAEHHAGRSASRTTKLYPSHRQHNKDRRAKHPRRRPAERYTAHAYCVAVARACKRAGVVPWTPNQLRHTHATRVRERYGLEAAQVVLGHARADVTQLYAERNMGLAATVAAELG